ncbi:MAG: YceI family protein [Acidobacteriota bacterium]
MRRYALLFAALVLAAPIKAETTVVQLDPAQTRIEFALHARLHTVHGTFRLQRGTIRFDPATGKAEGEVVVDARSGESGNSSRDAKMHKSVLESERFPEITFTPDRVEGNGARVHGRFRIHGAEHELALAVEAQMAQGQATATTHFEIPYVQWGMKDPSTFILSVSDKVEIDVRAVGRVTSADLFNGLKTYGQSQGLPKTRNFERRTPRAAAEYRCYYTGKLELPASYDELKVRETSGAPCRVDEKKYDAFFYAAEAFATGHAPVTAGLEQATLERQLMVAPHEDAHDARQMAKLDTSLSEAAATLAGFHVAAGFARERYGAESETYRKLAREPELFLAKAEIVNRYFERLAEVYASARAGRIKTKDALAIKEREMAELRRECGAIPRPASFNACPGAINNAGLAFDATYTRYYPLIYELYRIQGESFRVTLDTLAESARGRRLPDAEIRQRLRDAIERSRTSGPARPRSAS